MCYFYRAAGNVMKRNEMKRRQKRLAFTILEILVTVSMLALILAAVYGSYTAVTTSVEHCNEKSVLEQQTRLFLQRITSELRSCYAGRLDELSEGLSDKRLGKEFVGQEKQPIFVSRDAPQGQPLLRFVTSAVALRHNHNVCGLAMVSYKLDESGTTLLRSERQYLGRSENLNNDYNWYPVFTNVNAITFEYFGDKKWRREWNSIDMKGLPQAVRISLVLETEGTGPLSFISIANIVCREYQSSVVSVQQTHQEGKDGRSRNDSKIFKK
jgi:type II secretory pathway component PulJ